MGDLLRLATAGSVDDGKSTLIGRLLYDSRAVLADQLAHVEAVSARRRADGLDLALLTDGLRAEREQGITIDVAYRSFATPRRRFILADCPGHAQYTRNMVTGASTADLALLLVDARAGLTEQSRRHAAIAALLRLRHVVVAVNKMDLVDFSEDVFDGVVREVLDLGARVGLHEVDFIPISALHGDNVVERSARMPWYGGPALLERLETAPAGEPPDRLPARLPIQLVLRADDGRWAAGRLAAGTLRPGDEVIALPSGVRTRVAAVRDADGERPAIQAPQSVAVRLEDELDLARGELLAAAEDPPALRRELSATVCWLGDAGGRAGARYLIKHGTRTVPARLAAVAGLLDFATLEWRPAEELALNDIAHVELRLGAELAVDPYARSHSMGAFILVDDATNDTVAAGMVAAGMRKTG
jgi:sulfate adenylyltransferase large subunit